MIHEMEQHEQGCALTLTFDEEHLHSRKDRKDYVEKNWSVYGDDISRFIKKLRKYLNREYGYTPKFKFYGVGEYGTKNHRPHYHIAIFGWMPHDIDLRGRSTLIKAGASEQHLSEFVSRVWGEGYCSVGILTPASAGYIAGYVTKKYENTAKGRSEFVNGELQYVEPECQRMTKGIGFDWWEKHQNDALANNSITNATGDSVSRFGIPKSYLRKLEKTDPERYQQHIEKNRLLVMDTYLYKLRQEDKVKYANRMAELDDYTKIQLARSGNLNREFA